MTTTDIPAEGDTTETFGLPPVVPHLIAKLRNMDPADLARITGKEAKACHSLPART